MQEFHTQDEDIAIGVDLGTSNSVAAVWTPAGPVTIKDHASLYTPSVVAFTDKGERLVGNVARQQQPMNPRNTIHSIKQIIGRQYTDPVVAKSKAHWPFTVKGGSDGNCKILVSPGGRPTMMRPEAISAAVLSRMKANAEKKLNTSIAGAVITVPASFSNAQRAATQDAAVIAGLKVLKLMNEPSAAAYMYGTLPRDAAPVARHMLVFDLGGGTLDVAVLYVPASTIAATDEDMHVKAVDADLTLGGDTFTGRLAQYCLQELPQVTGFAPSVFRKPVVRSALYRECELVKRSLSECQSSVCNILLGGEKVVQIEVTRQKFEELCREDFQRIHGPLDRVLQQAGLQRDEIDRVLLVGGSTRIPAVHAILTDYFGDRVQLNHQVDPDEAVAHGAAIEAARLTGALQPDPLDREHIRSVSDPNITRDHQEALEGLRGTLGVGSRTQSVAQTMPGPARMPRVAQLPRMGSNFDVLPHTLSIVYGQGECWHMLKANHPYPVWREQDFPKQRPDQDSITISVVEGESLRAVENELVGRFVVSGLKSMPSGINVKFNVNDNGIVEVTALSLDDPANKAGIKVTALHARVPPEDLERLKLEEEIKQKLEQLIQDAEAQLKEYDATSHTVAHFRRVCDQARDYIMGVQTLSLEALEDLEHQAKNIPVRCMHSSLGG